MVQLIWGLWKVNSRQTGLENQNSEHHQTSGEFATFSSLLSPSLNSAQLNLEVKWAPRHRKSSRRSPPVWTPGAEKGAPNRRQRPFSSFQCIPASRQSCDCGRGRLQEPKFWGRRTFLSNWWSCGLKRMGPASLLSLCVSPGMTQAQLQNARQSGVTKAPAF